MNKQVFILSVALLCVLAAEAGKRGGFSLLTEDKLVEYKPKLDSEFGIWKEKHHDFGYTLHHIKSGMSETAAGANYIFEVDLHDAEKKVTPCQVYVSENLKGERVQFKVECGAKHFNFREHGRKKREGNY